MEELNNNFKGKKLNWPIIIFLIIIIIAAGIFFYIDYQKNKKQFSKSNNAGRRIYARAGIS